jgi:FkbM family methyltransferase
MTMLSRIDTVIGVTRSLLIYYGQPWRRRSLKRFYRDIVSPGDLVFDIGAHVGSRSRTLVSLGAEVVAVEPQPVFADMIEMYLANRLKGFERVAIGAAKCEATLHVSSRHPTVTTISDRFIEGVGQTAGFRDVVWDSEVTTPVITLDHLIETYGLPSFCKIDVEGAESDILRGLSRPIPLIAFEYTPALPQVAREAVERLGQLGPYRFRRVIGESHRFLDPEWKHADALLADLEKLTPDSPSGDVYARLAP